MTVHPHLEGDVLVVLKKYNLILAFFIRTVRYTVEPAAWF